MGISKNMLSVILPMIKDIVHHKYEQERMEGKDWFNDEYFIDFELFSIIKEAWSQIVPDDKKSVEPDWSEVIGSAYESEPDLI